MCVTFNRLSMLKQLLENYEAQEGPLGHLIVIDNYSSDGTQEFLEAWVKVPGRFARMVVRTAENLGGAGGFHRALTLARDLPADWVYVADDDAFPEAGFFTRAAALLSKHPESEGWSAVAGAVHDGGRLALAHRRRCRRKGFSVADEVLPEGQYGLEAFSIDVYSFVGVLLNQRLLQNSGVLPRKNYFIWYDDTDFSLRFGHWGPAFCFPELRVQHKDGDRGQFGWKHFYRTRNQLLTYRRRFGWFVFVGLFGDRFHRLSIRLAKALYKHDSVELAKLRLQFTALFACLFTRMGQHPTYRPGWKLSMNQGTPKK